jgi:hypothetical protein
MGLFDLPAPLLTWLDAALAPLLPPSARLAAWGIAGSALSMGLYWLLSAQEALARVKTESAAARRDLASYDGDFAGVLPRARRMLALSFRHIFLAGAPAVVASLPLISLITWASNTYGYVLPPAGDGVRVAWQPATVALHLEPGAFVVPDEGHILRWPEPHTKVTVRDPAGAMLAEIGPTIAAPVIRKRVWWNLLIGNPAGYLPENAAVDQIELELRPATYLTVGPDWLRGWEAALLLPLLITSIAIKVGFRIE